MNWRKEWGASFWLRSLLQVFLLQGALMLVIALPIIALTSSSAMPPISPFLFSTLSFPSLVLSSSLSLPSLLILFGLFLWLKGAFWEFVGDYQPRRFIAKKRNRGKLMTIGLWRYMRHPNYFGESLLWWGLGFIALGATRNWWVLLSPALLTFLLLKMSGVPMLEKKYAGRPDWEAYTRKTSLFIPWRPK